MARYKLSLSITQGDVAEYHTRRTYSPPSAEPSLASRNVHMYDPRHEDGSLVSYKEQFNSIFADAIERYNSKQKRKSRHMSSDYWDTITGSKRREKPVYSTVLQLGNRDTCGVTDNTFDAKHWRALKATDPEAAAAYVAEHLDPRPQQKVAKECIEEICRRFETWFPQIKVVAVVLHDDEVDGVCHATIDWTPVAGGEGSHVFKGGMDTRCSLNAALKQMGYNGKGYDYPIKQWQEDFKQKCEGVMAEYDIEREFMNNHERHKSVATWRVEQEREDEIAKLKEIKRLNEIARVNMADFEEQAQASEKKLADLEYQLSVTDAKYRESYAKMIDTERDLKSLQDRADATEARIRLGESRVRDAQAREDDARRAYRRVEDDTLREQKRLDDLKRQADEAQKKLEELTSWIEKMSDIRQMVLLFIKALLGYLEHETTDRRLSVTDRQSCVFAKGILTKLQADFITVASNAAKKSYEMIIGGKHIFDDVAVKQNAATPVSQEMKPKKQEGGQDWWDDYSSDFFLGTE